MIWRRLLRYGIGALFVTGMSGLSAAAYLQYQRARENILATYREKRKIVKMDAGEAEFFMDGDGPTVLVLHGMLGDYQQAFEEFYPLRQAGYRVLTISRPGYSQSKHAARTAHEVAAFYEEVLDQLEIETVAVVAMSAAGPSALAFAQNYPERCTSLITVAAVSGEVNLARMRVTDIISLLLRFANSDLLAWFLTRVIIWMLPISAYFNPVVKERVIADDENYERFVGSIRGFFPMSIRKQGFKNDVRQVAHLPLQNLSELTVPLLVLHGEGDSVVPVRHAHYIAENVPHACLKTFNHGAGHAFYLTHFDEVWPHIFAFLEEHYALPT